MSDKEEIRANFTEEDAKAHAVIRELLWLFYPQDKNLESRPTDDSKADEVAVYLVDALKKQYRAVI